MPRLKIRKPAASEKPDASNSLVLIPPQTYITAVRKTLRIIDLDPCSSDKAQQLIDALGWYRAEDANAALAEQWQGKVFLHPHWLNKIARYQLQKLLRDYLADRVDAAIIHISRHDWLRAEPLLLSFPFIIHYQRMPMWRWVEEKEGLERFNPTFNSYTVFLPHKNGMHFDDERIAAFVESFAMFGRTIIAEDLGDDWQQQALLATQRMGIKPVLTVSRVDRYVPETYALQEPDAGGPLGLD